MIRYFLLILMFSTLSGILSATETGDRAVIIKVTISQSPSLSIRLDWLPDSNATDYIVRRKFKESGEWTKLTKLKPPVTYFVDYDVSPGKGYEYYIEKWAGKYDGYGYAYAGIELPAVEYRGKVLLLIDSTMLEPLDFEIQRYEQDLSADGWEVIIKPAPRAEAFNAEKVARTKNIVMDEFRKDSVNLKALILLGRVPVPYSGAIPIDSHSDHSGAWPADVYYSVMGGEWTDQTVNVDSSQRPENWNLPQDGKYDQQMIPSDARLQSGRIDMYNLPQLTTSETELLRRYLDKNHAFRHKTIDVANRALIDDGFKMYSYEAFAATAWMNFPVLVPPDSVFEDSFISTMMVKDYLWAYGCNSGGYNSVYRTLYTSEIDSLPYNGIFTILFGSYNGDYDSPNNVLRAAIASNPSILTCSWAGRPFWHFHHMTLGETIGYSAKLTQNNKTLYLSSGVYGLRGIHIELMGDPTLKMHYIDPPRNLAVKRNTDGTSARKSLLTWNPSGDDILGYNIYRAEFPGEKYVKINDVPVTDTSFIDETPYLITNYYQVKAVSLEQTPVGTYYDLSLGAFGSYNFVGDTAGIYYKVIPNPVTETAQLYFFLPETMQLTLDIFNSNGAHVKKLLDGSLGKGVNKLYWDLTDKTGSSVSSGVYFLRLTYGNKSKLERIVVLH